jgi:hypothetical protein
LPSRPHPSDRRSVFLRIDEPWASFQASSSPQLCLCEGNWLSLAGPSGTAAYEGALPQEGQNMRCRATMYYARVSLPPWHLRRRQQDSPPPIARHLVSQRDGRGVCSPLAWRVNAISMLEPAGNRQGDGRYGVNGGKAEQAARLLSPLGVLVANASEETNALERRRR